MNNNVIPIFYACDDNFVKYLIVSLSSMIRNASKDKAYHIHVLHTNITEKMQQKVLALKTDCFEISFEDVTDYLKTINDKLPLRHYYTKTTYFRLFIADMFPQYDKAIYIDSDTIVQGDISRLYAENLGDRYIGACHEQAMVQVDVYGTYCEQVVGVSRHNYFNAGVLLINCRAFRTKKVLDKFMEYLCMYNFVVTQDEDYLNLICKDHVKLLDQHWNTEITDGLKYPYDTAKAYILHYIMVNKPWHYETCRHADIFWKYADETEMAAELRAELAAYTDEQRARDLASAQHLCQMAQRETENQNNFQHILDRTVHAADRVEIMKKIEQFEREGKFDVDVEDDPPTKPLNPGDIDYLRRSILAKARTRIAHMRAKRFFRYIVKHKLIIIKSINGVENMAGLTSGAVITCNHFSPFDSFAMQAAYDASRQKKNKRNLYRVIREGNYTSFPGFYGYLMRNYYTLPLSSNPTVMRQFVKATDKLLTDGNFVLVYPEQSMWWNYRKPKPLKPGAYRFAVKNNVPVLPCFITMQDSDVMGRDGYYVQEYTINIGKPIYPDQNLEYRDNLAMLMEENAKVWREIYERDYEMPLEYLTEQEKDPQ